jgi:DNA polymerase I-like protein with 3'-5' exonuclease and polymerase domains
MKMTGVGADIAKWYVAKHRQSQIEGWMKKVRPDERLTAGANTIGTPTYRFTHRTVVNVPKADPKVWFGALMRALFQAREGYVLVGHDASGLELRMLAHYINNPEYTDVVLNGDIHWHHVQMLGFVPWGTERDEHNADHSYYRNVAKTFIYAFIYGAGDGKLGTIIGGTSADGKKLRAQFLSANPALASLIDEVKVAARRGYLVGLDGRRIYLRRDKLGRLQIHKALNTLLQTAGAIVMKYSMVALSFRVRQLGLDATKVIDMHDEAQAEVAPQDVSAYRREAEASIPWAGEFLNLNIPLAADSKVGLNWAETH